MSHSSIPSAHPGYRLFNSLKREGLGPEKAGLKLRDQAQSRLWLQPEEAKGTVVLYHGFTAGPWQYPEMADVFLQNGYNVYAPRMPGHGLADAEGPSDRFIPHLGDQHRWNEFADRTVQEAAELGVPVHLVGLSGGGNVALAGGAQNPEVESVTAIAPFLGGNGLAGAIWPAMNLLDTITFGLVGKLLDGWARESQPQVEGTPKTQGTWGQALASYRLGARLSSIPSRVQIVTTEGDQLSGTGSIRRLLQKCRNWTTGWFHFGSEQGVPHAMVSPLENPNHEAVEILHQTVLRFIDQGQPTTN